MSKRITRRELLRMGGLGGVVLLAAACQPEVVENIVKETVVVEKEVQSEFTQIVVKLSVEPGGTVVWGWQQVVIPCTSLKGERDETAIHP